MILNIFLTFITKRLQFRHVIHNMPEYTLISIIQLMNCHIMNIGIRPIEMMIQIPLRVQALMVSLYHHFCITEL
jgi:hypothetical protein